MIDKATNEIYRVNLRKDKITPQLFGKYFCSLVPVAFMVSAENALGIKIDEYVITNKQVTADHFN